MNKTKLMCLLILLLVAIQPASSADKDIALVLKTLGDVELSVPGRSNWLEAKRGQTVQIAGFVIGPEGTNFVVIQHAGAGIGLQRVTLPLHRNA